MAKHTTNYSTKWDHHRIFDFIYYGTFSLLSFSFFLSLSWPFQSLVLSFLFFIWKVAWTIVVAVIVVILLSLFLCNIKNKIANRRNPVYWHIPSSHRMKWFAVRIKHTSKKEIRLALAQILNTYGSLDVQLFQRNAWNCYICVGVKWKCSLLLHFPSWLYDFGCRLQPENFMINTVFFVRFYFFFIFIS